MSSKLISPCFTEFYTSCKELQKQTDRPDTWMRKLGLRPRISFSGNKLMGFSLQCWSPRDRGGSCLFFTYFSPGPVGKLPGAISLPHSSSETHLHDSARTRLIVEGRTMDQINLKTPNSKFRLYWCLIEFIGWRYSQSCWYFRPIFVNCCPSPSNLLSGYSSPPPLPPFPVWICILYTHIQGVGGGVWGHRREGASDS